MGYDYAMGAATVVSMMIFYLMMFAGMIATYILSSLALYKIAERRKIANAWLAWIPIGSDWIIGAIARIHDERDGIKRRWDKILVIFDAISVIGIVIFYILFFVLMFVIMFTANGRSYFEVTPGIAVMMILSLLGFVAIMLCAVVYSYVRYICIYKIFESTVPEKSVKYMILSLLIPLAQCICLFLCRDKGYPVPAAPGAVMNGSANTAQAFKAEPVYTGEDYVTVDETVWKTAEATEETEKETVWKTAEVTEETEKETVWKTAEATEETEKDTVWKTAEATEEAEKETVWKTAEATEEAEKETVWKTAETTGKETAEKTVGETAVCEDDLFEE